MGRRWLWPLFAPQSLSGWGSRCLNYLTSGLLFACFRHCVFLRIGHNLLNLPIISTALGVLPSLRSSFHSFCVSHETILFQKPLKRQSGLTIVWLGRFVGTLCCCYLNRDSRSASGWCFSWDGSTVYQRGRLAPVCWLVELGASLQLHTVLLIQWLRGTNRLRYSRRALDPPSLRCLPRLAHEFCWRWLASLNPTVCQSAEALHRSGETCV